MKRKPKKVFSIFLLAMMNVAIIMSLRGLPLMAKEGVSLVFYLLFSLIIFLIPSALVCAELATGWSEGGGVFKWVTEAFGEKAGLTAIWLQWVQNIFWYPTVLAFAAGALSYLFGKPALFQNPLYNISVILLVFWSATFINMRGVSATGKLASTGVILGTILPGILIISLGITWALKGHPIEFFKEERSIFPSFSKFSNLSLLAGIVLLFAGVEVNAVHALNVKNPKKSYPLAILLSVILIFAIFFLGSLAVAAVIPHNQISLTAGIMQAFSQFFTLFNIEWLVPVIGLLAAFGALGGVAAWIVGPSKGLLATSRLGLIPPLLSHVNKHGIPVNILWIQGIVVTLISFVYLIEPQVNNAFFLLTDLTVMLYLIMYILLFSSAIYLRYKQPNRPRPYKVPGGNFGMWVVGGIGILGAIFSIFIGFFPPSQLQFRGTSFFVSFLGVGIFLALLLPQIIYRMRKPKWKREAEKIQNTE